MTMAALKPKPSEDPVAQHRRFVSHAIARSLLALPFSNLDATDPDGIVCRYYQKLVESVTGELPTDNVLGLVSLIQGDAALHEVAGNHDKAAVELRWCEGLMLHLRAQQRPALDLSSEEVAALRKAHEHVRLHMAHHHTWDERDAAMNALSKVLDAAKRAS